MSFGATQRGTNMHHDLSGRARDHVATVPLATVLALVVCLCSVVPRPANSREGKWEVPADGSRQVDDIGRLRAKKEAQQARVRELVEILWDELYEVYVSDSTDIQTYNQFSVPNQVRYSIPVSVRYNANTLEAARRVLGSPELTGGQNALSFTLPSGRMTIYLYDEVLPIFNALSDGGRWPFQCRVVLLDENQEVLGRSDSVLYVYANALNFTASPWVGSYAQVSNPPELDSLAGLAGPDAGTESMKLIEDLRGCFSTADTFYYLASSDRVLFEYLSLDILDRVASIRVLRPDDALLLYRGE